MTFAPQSHLFSQWTLLVPLQYRDSPPSEYPSHPFPSIHHPHSHFSPAPFPSLLFLHSLPTSDPHIHSDRDDDGAVRRTEYPYPLLHLTFPSISNSPSSSSRSRPDLVYPSGCSNCPIANPDLFWQLAPPLQFHPGDHRAGIYVLQPVTIPTPSNSHQFPPRQQRMPTRRNGGDRHWRSARWNLISLLWWNTCTILTNPLSEMVEKLLGYNSC